MSEYQGIKFMESVTAKLIKTYKQINEMCKDRLNQNIINTLSKNQSKKSDNQFKDFTKDKNQSNKDIKKQDQIKSKALQSQAEYSNNSRIRNPRMQEANSRKNQLRKNDNQKTQKIPQKKKKDQQTQPTGNGFMLYFHERQKQLTAKRPDATVISISKQITQEWQLMDPSKKAFYTQSTKGDKLQKSQNLKTQNTGAEAAKKMKKIVPVQQKTGGRKAMNYDSSDDMQDGEGESFDIQSGQSMDQVGISEGSD